MKKIIIFISTICMLLSIVIISTSAEEIKTPDYVLLPDLSQSNIAYPIYSPSSVTEPDFKYIGLLEVYKDIVIDNKLNITFVSYPGSVANVKITIEASYYDPWVNLYVIDYDERITYYSGQGGNDVMIAGSMYDNYGEGYYYIFSTGQVRIDEGNINELLPFVPYSEFIENYPDYVLYNPNSNLPIESTPVETEPLEPTPTLPPYTMPDDIINTTKDAFGNFIVGIGGVTLEGYEALFFKEGTLTNIGTCFLVIIGVCFACFILTWIFKRGKNE